MLVLVLILELAYIRFRHTLAVFRITCRFYGGKSTMKTRLHAVAVLSAAFLMFASLSWGDSIIKSYAPVLSGGTVANFEGFNEFTRINTQYPGMTFSQTPSGSPMIDNYQQNGGRQGCSVA